MRRLREEINYYCACGHFMRQHDLDDYSGACLEQWECDCLEYKRDNLRYLEKISAS